MLESERHQKERKPWSWTRCTSQRKVTRRFSLSNEITSAALLLSFPLPQSPQLVWQAGNYHQTNSTNMWRSHQNTGDDDRQASGIASRLWDSAGQLKDESERWHWTWHVTMSHSTGQLSHRRASRVHLSTAPFAFYFLHKEGCVGLTSFLVTRVQSPWLVGEMDIFSWTEPNSERGHQRKCVLFLSLLHFKEYRWSISWRQ